MARKLRAGALAILGLTIAAVPAVSTSQTQVLQPRQTPGPRFMVPVLRSSERSLGATFADQLRERLGGDFMGRTLWIIVKADIDNALEQSGYSRTEPLNANDAKQLAILVRAEEYLEGAINKTDTGYEFTGTLQLVRGEGMIQPLPPVTGARPADVAKGLSTSIDQARRPVAEVQSCVLKWRQNKFAEAMTDAQKGLRDYPSSVMARVCALEIANSQKWGADSIIRIGEEITKIHPTNRRALTLLADAYNEKKMDQKYISTLTTLLSADPTNVRLVETVVNAIAQTRQFDVARPIIDEAVRQNPGDPALIRMQWRIYLAMNEFAKAAAIGEEMIKSDTAAADSSFFTRLTAAYISAGDTARALEAASRGAAKFPTNVEAWQAVGQLARQMGQLPVALNAYQKVIALAPKTPGVRLQVARIMMDQDQSDSAMALLRAALEDGEDKTLVGGMATTIANRIFTAYQRSEEKDQNQVKKALEILTWSETVDKTPATYFLLGVANMTLGFTQLQEAGAEKSCDKAKLAKDYLTNAQIHMPKGGNQFAEQLRALMPQLMQYADTPDQMTKAYCK
ncbi:MAG: tetratricopeptide repeat protein [Gemmatimonadota bacterium]